MVEGLSQLVDDLHLALGLALKPCCTFSGLAELIDKVVAGFEQRLAFGFESSDAGPQLGDKRTITVTITRDGRRDITLIITVTVTVTLR